MEMKIPSGAGTTHQGNLIQKLQLNTKLYVIAYKQYVKAKGKFSTHNPLGAQIGQDVKICDENSENKINDDEKYNENNKKK